MKTGFLFSGQGAQYPGMMKDLYDTEPAAREVFSCADRVLGREISALCFEGTQEDLNLTHNTQPCMLAGDLAAAQAEQHRANNVIAELLKYGVMASCKTICNHLGLSLGECRKPFAPLTAQQKQRLIAVYEENV